MCALSRDESSDKDIERRLNAGKSINREMNAAVGSIKVLEGIEDGSSQHKLAEGQR